MVGRIAGLYVKSFTGRVLVSVCLVMVVIRRGCGCFGGGLEFWANHRT